MPRPGKQTKLPHAEDHDGFRNQVQVPEVLARTSPVHTGALYES